jgi:multiple sugar transport system permease protein|tara:strand:- start:2653 stop:3894 length:1242 start_codon:yes stop_codon:yes gene_type:complete
MQKINKESRLAYTMLIPTISIVFLIILFPIFGNFWLSFKEVKLGDLRPPQPIVKEKVITKNIEIGSEVIIEYRFRNSSQKKPIFNIMLSDIIPQGLEPIQIIEECEVVKNKFHCYFEKWEPKFNKKVKFKFLAKDDFDSNQFDPKKSKPNSSADADNILTNFKFSLKNFQKIFKKVETLENIKVTFIYSFFATLGAIFLGICAALLLEKKFFGKGLFRGLFLFPFVSPVIAVAFTWVYILDPFKGFLNNYLIDNSIINEPIFFLGIKKVSFFGLDFPFTLFIVILFESWRYFPLAFLFILARLQSIPKDLYEASEIDGASKIQQFFYVTLPQLIGVISLLFILRFIWNFNKFEDIFLLTGGNAGTRTLTVQVYDEAFALTNMGTASAVAVIIFILLGIFVFIHNKVTPKDIEE